MGGSDLMADAGKIMFTLKGDYDETVPYEILDVVTYDSSLYVSRINNNLGYAPSDTEKWQLLIQKSDVVGVKGDAETDYRTGLVNITPKDIGLGDLKDVAFSGDYNDLDNIPKDWEDNTLNTLAEIEAATEENLIAGALAVKELFTFVSNGKELVASAITDKGVDTASDATFQTMATNISNINTGSGVLAKVRGCWYYLFGLRTFTMTNTNSGSTYLRVVDPFKTKNIDISELKNGEEFIIKVENLSTWGITFIYSYNGATGYVSVGANKEATKTLTKTTDTIDYIAAGYNIGTSWNNDKPNIQGSSSGGNNEYVGEVIITVERA